MLVRYDSSTAHILSPDPNGTGCTVYKVVEFLDLSCTFRRVRALPPRVLLHSSRLHLTGCLAGQRLGGPSRIRGAGRPTRIALRLARGQKLRLDFVVSSLWSKHGLPHVFRQRYSRPRLPLAERPRSRGRVFAFGENSKGQLGLGDRQGLSFAGRRRGSEQCSKVTRTRPGSRLTALR